MDKLEQAMQSEDFWIELADTSFGKVVLHGKNTNSIADYAKAKDSFAYYRGREYEYDVCES